MTPSPLTITRVVGYLHATTGDKRVLVEATIPPDGALPVLRPAPDAPTSKHDLELIGSCSIAIDGTRLVATITLPDGKRPRGFPVATFVGSAPVPVVENGQIVRINIVGSVAAGVVFVMNPAWEQLAAEPDL